MYHNRPNVHKTQSVAHTHRTHKSACKFVTTQITWQTSVATVRKTNIATTQTNMTSTVFLVTCFVSSPATVFSHTSPLSEDRACCSFPLLLTLDNGTDLGHSNIQRFTYSLSYSEQFCLNPSSTAASFALPHLNDPHNYNRSPKPSVQSPPAPPKIVMVGGIPCRAFLFLNLKFLQIPITNYE